MAKIHFIEQLSLKEETSHVKMKSILSSGVSLEWFSLKEETSQMKMTTVINEMYNKS